MRQYEEFLISGIPIAILVVLIGRKIFRNPTLERSTQWIRIILLTQAVLTLISFFYQTFLYDDENLLVDRFNSQYSFAYIFMLLSNTLLPLLLLNKNLGRNLWVLLVVGILMNFGRIFESIVIITTSYHRDYGSFTPMREIETMIKGLLLGIVMITLEFTLQKNDLRFVDNQLGNRVNYTPLLIICLCVMLYSIGAWLTSFYGFDPPYGYFYAGWILERIAILVLGLLALNYLEIIFKKKHNRQIHKLPFRLL